VCIISDRLRFVHPRYSHRILYAGHDLSLLKFLNEILEDCQIVRCGDGTQARLFIEKINYLLLLFDKKLPDTTGAELESYTRTVAGRGLTPIIIVKKSDSYDVLARTITHLLSSTS
jgi:DNA-binding response OmpR family regulator